MPTSIEILAISSQSTVAIRTSDATVRGAAQNDARIEPLTSVRFLASAMIVLYHSSQSFPIDKSGFIASCALEQGVSFFFVLSGFIIYYAYPVLASTQQKVDFLCARFARIWPAHLSATLLFIALNRDWWLPKGATVPWITLANVSLVQAWIPQARCYFSLNAPAWSVSVEWFFYLAYLFIVMQWSRTWPLKLIGSMALTVSLFALCSYLQFHGTHTPILIIYHALLYINPLARVFEFVLGMTTALAFLSLRDKQIGGIKISLLEAVMLILIIANLYLTPHLIGFEKNKDSYVPVLHWLQHTSGAPLYAGLIALIALQKGFISKLLSNRPMIFLGEISYSMYLVHWIILQFFVSHQVGATLPLWLTYASYWLCVLVSSALNFLIVERPCRSFLKKRLSHGFSKLVRLVPISNIT